MTCFQRKLTKMREFSTDPSHLKAHLLPRPPTRRSDEVNAQVAKEDAERVLKESTKAPPKKSPKLPKVPKSGPVSAPDSASTTILSPSTVFY